MKKIILFSAFLSLFFLFFQPPTDPDLFWHLRYGEEILKTHQIPHKDQFSFTFTGYRVADSWWLSEVLIFYLVSKTGFLIPSLFFALLGAAIFLLVGLGASLKKVSPEALSGSVFLGAIISWQILGLRPQTISLVFLGLVFVLLCQFWLGRRPKLILFLPPIFLFWTNFHAGFTLGLFLIWLFWGLEAGRFLILKYFRISELATPFLARPQLKTLLVINLFSTLVTLINPYGVGLWQTILNDASSAEIKNQIAEWSAPNFHTEFGVLFFFYLLVLVVFAYLGKIKVHPTRFLILLTFCLLALAAVRHVSVFALLSTPFLAEELTALPWGKIDFPLKKLVLALFFLVFSLVWMLMFSLQIFKDTRSIQKLASAGKYPYQAIEYLKSHPQERIFNDYGWGGYLIWQLPQNKTFIDGRMPGWKRGEREILEDYIKIVDLKKDFLKEINFWQVKAFLISPDSSLSNYLRIHPDWEKRYEDETAIIFTHR